MKPVLLVAVLLFCQLLVAAGHSTAAEDHEFQLLYSELKYIESETLRVEVTIEILEDRLHETPALENPEDLFLHLESLYKYYIILGEHQRELNDRWNQLSGADTGASFALTPEQFKPIPIVSNEYLPGPPEDTMPSPTYLPIPVK